MPTYAKPHLTLEQQVKLLVSRGMQVEETAEGARWLGLVGYYRLSGYWYPFRRLVEGVEGRADQFLEGTTFKQIIDLYDFDRRLKLMILEALERIEIAMRCKVGYTLGLRSAYAHLDAATLDGKFTERPRSRPGVVEVGRSRYDEWLAKVVEYQARSKEDFVKHFRVKYDGRLPVWVATEILDFGALSVLYEGLQHSDRDRIATELDVTDAQGGNGRALANWMHVLNYVRNVSAHQSRLWNRNLPIQISMKQLRRVPGLAHLPESGFNIARLFGPISVIVFLLDRLEIDRSWSTELTTLVRESLPPTGRQTAEMGFPPSWEHDLTVIRHAP